MVFSPLFLCLVSPKLKASEIETVEEMIIPQNQWKINSCRQNQYFCKRPYVHTSWAERYTCLLVKKSPL